MALRSEQARVLRRRVLVGVIRNLVIFTLVFAGACFVVQKFAVPSLADYVADSTSTWHFLDDTGAYEQLAEEAGLLDSDMFYTLVKYMEEDGFPAKEGTATKVQEELVNGSEAIRQFSENPEKALKEKSDEAEGYPEDEAAGDKKKMGNASASVGEVVYVPTVDDYLNTADAVASAAAGDDVSVSGPSAPESDVPPGDAAAGVPFVGWEDILRAFDIEPDAASAAEAMAALRVSASIQELRLSVKPGAPYVPEQASEHLCHRILSVAASEGYDEESLRTVLADLYRNAQMSAYDAWLALPAAEEAQALGVTNDRPLWQIEADGNGTYRIRDISTYAFVKSFKIPLAIVVFVAGWLIIMFRALNRSLRYFDDLSGAVAALLADKDAPIELPRDLSIARNELAVIRSQSLADERAAHAAEQRKNELVAYLAHDIRTPLTSVLGYLDLLRESTDLPREKLRRYADIAYSKAERLESLINEFFEITRYNLSAIPIERETVGVRLFCQQVAESFFPEASARGIRITVDTGPYEQFFVDPDKLARALGNVMRNAVAYADSNSIIALAARQEGRFTTITVANRGREISEAHLESIFEKFYREDGARSSRSGGAGLGLAIAKEIVVAHHGEIEAASQRGVTVFTLRIPTHGEEAPIPADASPLPTPARTGALPPVAGRAGALSPDAERAAAPTPGSERAAAPAPDTGRAGALPHAARTPASSPAPTPRRAARGTTAPSHSAEASRAAPQLKPRNARQGHGRPHGTVGDNGTQPRRRGLPR